MSALRVNFERLQKDLEELGEIGRGPDHGIYRMFLTDAEIEARNWFRKRVEDAGLSFHSDPATNLFAKLESPAVAQKAAVMTGSHLDSVPAGGQLDGALGVVAGLEALRRLKEIDAPLKRPVELVAFADEEGRFGGMLGSMAVAGRLTPDTLFNAKDLEENTLSETMERQGYDLLAVLKAARSPEELHSFVELHIEQGPILDRKEVSVGIVEGIAGLFKWQVRFLGVANHSGTTPMDLRFDAFQGVAEVAREIDRILEENGSPQTVCNIGKVELKPGVANVIPGVAEFVLEVRDVDPQILGDLVFAFRKAMSAIARRRGLMFEFDVLSELAPVQCDRKLVSRIESAASDVGVSSHRMMSGAAHDAMNMESLGRVAMLFVPSKDGKSHSPAEWTDWRDIENGANVLLNTLYPLACSDE